MLWLGLAPPDTVVFQAATSEEAQMRAMLLTRPVRVVPNPYAVAKALEVQNDRFVLTLWKAAKADRAGKLRSASVSRRDGDR